MGEHRPECRAIVALSPALDAATKAEFRTWGPGKYDPRHHYFNGTSIVPLNTPSLPIVIPAIYGLRGVGFETVTGDVRFPTGMRMSASDKWAGMATSVINDFVYSFNRRPTW
jgi:hypothetical protein